MGKPFSAELLRIPRTLQWAAQADMASFREFLDNARGATLHIIGAGGSFSAAEFARLLHEERGGKAMAHTPLSFLQSATAIAEDYVLIFTASGGNRDILATYDAATAREPRGIIIVCGRKNSKVEQRARGDERTEIFARPFPAGKDGYLATNSLVGFIALTWRAFVADLPEGELSGVGGERTSLAPDELNRAEHYLALFGGWGRPAATDLESKFSEAGLGGVMLADYRNFAHGRHNWIDKKGANSTVVAFLTPDSEALARRTLQLLPRTTRVIRLSTEMPGAAGAAALLLQVFRLTEAVGQRVGIDPGRPRVPGYGRRIYHLGPVLPRPKPKRFEAAIERKLIARNAVHHAADRRIVTDACAAYVDTLSAAKFGAIVFDFDGTIMRPGAGSETALSDDVAIALEKILAMGVPVFFATGRGNSIHPILLRSLDKKRHPLVTVAYYNGAVTRPLLESPPAEEEGQHYALFGELKAKLGRDESLTRTAGLQNKGFQLTLRMADHSAYAFVATRIREVVLADYASVLRVVESSHSLDVIPRATTKLTAVQRAREAAEGKEVLTVGDRGALPGNDYDLLTHSSSLSVDTVSTSLTSCWNLLPAGVRNVSGMLHAMRWMRFRPGSFLVNPT